MIGVGIDTIYKYDLITGKLLLNLPLGDHDTYGGLCGLDSEGYFYHATDAHAVSMHLCKRHPETLAVVAKTTERVPVSVSGFVLNDKIYAPRARRVYDLGLKEIADLSDFFPYASEAPMCADSEGRYWQAAKDKIRRVEVDILGNGDLAEWDVAAWTSGQTPNVLFWDDTTGHLYFKLNSLKRIVKWHPNDGYVGHVDDVAISAGYSMQGDYSFPQKGRLWTMDSFTVTLVDLVSMRIEKRYDLSAFAASTGTAFSACYEKFTHSMIMMTGSGEVKYPLERYGSEQVALTDIIDDLCERAGLKPTDILTNEIDQPVRGYVVGNRMAARKTIEPLLGAFFIDAVEKDGQLHFIKRGQDKIVTVAYDDLGAMEGTTNDNPLRVTESRTQELELPQRLDLTHHDPDRDYQSNTQNAARTSNAITTKDQQTVELSLVLSADEAAQIAEKMLTSAWIERNSFAFNLPSKWLRLDPTDVIDVALPDAILSLRLTQVDFGGNNLVACKAVAEDGLAYVSTAKGCSAALTASIIPIALPTSAFMLDLPMLRDGDDGLGLYYAFALKNTSSASLYRSPDALTWDVVGTGSNDAAYGWAANALN